MISYYELLGLIKEGKQPSKVKYGGYIYYYDGVQFMSYIKEATLLEQFADYEMFIKNIEIIEEKPKQIEEIEFNLENDIIYFGEDRVHYIGTTRKDRDVYIPKINEIIDKVNDLLKEDKHE